MMLAFRRRLRLLEIVLNPTPLHRLAFLVPFLTAISASPLLGAQSAPSVVTPPREAAAAIVAKIQHADYEGDRVALDTLYGELLPFVDQPEIGSRVRYWRGFAKWRRAINGANETPTPTDLVRDLADGEAEFAAALEVDPTFVDAKVGAASCAILRFYFEGTFSKVTDYAALRALMAPSGRLLKDAQAAAPDNPRLLWVVGQNQWSTASAPSGQSAVLGTYQRGLEAARAQRGMIKDPLEPSWGEPELLMNMAWSNLHRSEPDLDAAEQDARAALELVPHWHYVRDILLPQILEAKAKKQPH